jgi:two-component system LytT family sensor kinase
VTTPPSLAPSPAIGSWRLVRTWVLLAVALTLLMTAQGAVQLGVHGPDLLRRLGLNALDWLAWTVQLPAILAVGRRHRLDDRRLLVRHGLVWLGLAVAAVLVQGVVTGLAARAFHLFPRGFPMAGQPLLDMLGPWVLSTAGFNLVFFAVIAGVVHAVIYDADLGLRRERQAELEARLARAELSVLRMQLQPHFFFNALHTVSSLMRQDIAQAERVIAALGDLVRASIDHTARQEVTLREELGFVERYLEIQRARFRSRLAVTVDAPDELADALLPSLMVQPLVENAIRHGIEPAASGGDISIRVARRDGRLTLVVRNSLSMTRGTGRRDGLEWPPATGPRQGPSGIGLANIEARLLQLYGDGQRLRAGPSGDDGFEVFVEVPYRTS